jgi:GTPase SAR1 family protein
MIGTTEMEHLKRRSGPGERTHQRAAAAGGIARTRGELIAILTALEEVAVRQEAQATKKSIGILLGKLEQNRFYLTVVGQFKRGKTSFLNALLGADVLPVAILPLTSIVTILQYSDQPHADVVFQSGARSAISLDALPDFVTEKGNPRNSRGVSYVEVFYPSEYLRGGVALIDTPGIGSVYAHNTQVTYEFLPQIDAAIFVTSPEPPITSTEIEFLSDIASHVRKVFVVLNKTDLLNDGQLREVMEFTRNSLPAEIASGPDSWFAVSATRALRAKQAGDEAALAASGFSGLERSLSEFLVSEKTLVFYSSVARNSLKLISDLRLAFELQIRAAQMPLEELQTKLAELENHLAYAEQQKEDSQVLVQNSVTRLARVFEEEARRHAEEMLEPIRGEIRACTQRVAALGRRQQAAEMDRFLKARIEKLFDDWRDQFEHAATERFRQATKRFEGNVNEIIAGVRETVGALFGFTVQGLDVTEELAELEPCGYFTDPVLDWGLGNLPLLLPFGLFRRYLVRTMLRKAESELDRNATRVAFDYKRRLNKSLAAFLSGMAAKLNETVDGIRRAIEGAAVRQQEGSAAVELQVRERQTALAALGEYEERLKAIAVQYARGDVQPEAVRQ